MADLISLNQLANASADAQTLADAINGNDQLDVISRLGATYPTLAKAIKLIMQKAPINSTPFATKTALLADTTLLDGAFAFVYNDPDDNNGLYQKVSSVWQYQKWNPLNEAKAYANNTFEPLTNISFARGYVYTESGARIQIDAEWYSTGKFYLKKGQSISLSVFTPAGQRSIELGSLIVFDENGNVISTKFGTYGSNDRNQRVNTIYTASQDCYIALQSIHNLAEGYDGLDDYCVINHSNAVKPYVDANFASLTNISFARGYVYTESGARIQIDAEWYSTGKFYLKKGQSISLSVFTPAGQRSIELGSLIVFDENGNVISTKFGTYGSNDRNQRVNTIYTASQDCYIALQSIHNLAEGYDGLDDYCVIYDSDLMLIDYFKTRLASAEQQISNNAINLTTENGYLISYFGENDVGQDLILAYSKDGINFKQITRFVPPTTNTIRDPSILHHKNGWWYVCHTNTPYGNGFVAEKFNLIKSRDLINWYQVGRIGFDGVANWAPEFFVDDDGSVHIIGSTTLTGSFQPYIFSALDDDLNTWSAGQKIQGAFNSASTSTSSTWIDGCMFKVGAEYHLIIKDETAEHRWLSIFKSTSLKSGFDTIVKDGAQSWGAISQKVEAPCIVKMDNGYRIYADGLPTYQGGLGQFLMYQDFDANFNPITNDVTKITSDTPMRHGTVIKVTGVQQYLTQANFVADNVADTATADDTASILAELRNLKSALIDAGLMRLN